MTFKKNFILLILLIILVTGCQNNTPPFTENHEPESSLEVPQELEKIKDPLIVNLSNTEIFPGDFFSIIVQNTEENDELVLFSPISNPNEDFYPLGQGIIRQIGVNYHTKPGQYECQIQINRSGTTIFNETFTIDVNPKEFPAQYLKVSNTQLSIRAPEHWEDDEQYIEIAKSVSAAAPLWEGNFLQPVQGRISTEYGVIRYINNKESGRHAGIDIAAPRKTPIKATNSGIITMGRYLNVTGNTVIVDHGFNLFSSYAHLDEIYVNQGQFVKKGDIIGEVGSTGFSTGPHLHWTLSLKEVFVNPWLFIESDPLMLLKD